MEVALLVVTLATLGIPVQGQSGTIDEIVGTVGCVGFFEAPANEMIGGGASQIALWLPGAVNGAPGSGFGIGNSVDGRGGFGSYLVFGASRDAFACPQPGLNADDAALARTIAFWGDSTSLWDRFWMIVFHQGPPPVLP